MPDSARHTIFRSMWVLAAGAGAAKVIGLLAIPLLTRIYTPEHFGVLAIFTTVVALLAPVVSLRYVMAIPLPKTDAMAFNVLALSGLLTLVLTLVVAVVIGLLADRVFPLLSVEALIPYWWLIPLAILGVSVYEILLLWATRKKAFRTISTASVGQSLAGNLLKIILGLLALKPLGLLLGQLVAQSAGISLYVRAFKHSYRQHLTKVNWQRVQWLAGFYWSLPAFRLPSQFILVFSTKAPLLFMAAFYSAEATGQLALALMALAVPMSLFGRTMGKAYFSEVAAIGKHEPARIKQLTRDVVKKLFLVSVVPALVLMVASPTLFAFVFGEQWRQAGVFTSLLAMYLMFQFVASPLVNVLTVFHKQQVFLWLNLLRLLVIVGVFATAYYLDYSANWVVGLYSVALSVYYLYVMRVTFNNIGLSSKVNAAG